jgi:hypothetical protein
MNATPRAGAGFRGLHQIRALILVLPIAAIACPAVMACPYPDEGTMPLRRALTRVQMLPETEAWQRERRDAGEPVQFRLFLEKEAYFNRKCHWTVEAVAKDEVWRRFYVSPDGKSVLIDYASQQAAEPPKATRAPEPKAARP